MPPGGTASELRPRRAKTRLEQFFDEHSKAASVRSQTCSEQSNSLILVGSCFAGESAENVTIHLCGKADSHS